jgi:hypothetical protein
MTMPSERGTTVRMPHHRAATHLLGGACLRGPRMSWGVHDCIWPYTMIQTCRHRVGDSV